MGMPRGLIRATNYYNKIEAWNDWRKMAQRAIDAGKAELAEKYQPKPDAGWRTIDKCIAKVRAELEAQS